MSASRTDLQSTIIRREADVIRKLSILPALLVLAVVGAVGAATPETHERISLWPNGAPGSEARRKEPEEAKDYWVKNIHDPSIEVYLPPPDKATPAARFSESLAARQRPGIDEDGEVGPSVDSIDRVGRLRVANPVAVRDESHYFAAG
jgi:hypothetical protein